MFYYKYHKYKTKLDLLNQFGGDPSDGRKAAGGGGSNGKRKGIKTASRLSPIEGMEFIKPSADRNAITAAADFITTYTKQINKFFNYVVTNNLQLIFIDGMNISHNVFVLCHLLLMQPGSTSAAKIANIKTIIQSFERLSEAYNDVKCSEIEIVEKDEEETKTKSIAFGSTREITRIIQDLIGKYPTKYAAIITRQSGTNMLRIGDKPSRDIINTNVMTLDVKCDGCTKHESDDFVLIKCFHLFQKYLEENKFSKPVLGPVIWSGDGYSWHKHPDSLNRVVLLVTYKPDIADNLTFDLTFIDFISTSKPGPLTVIAGSPGLLNQRYFILDNSKHIKFYIALLTHYNKTIELTGNQFCDDFPRSLFPDGETRELTIKDRLFKDTKYNGDAFERVLLNALLYKSYGKTPFESDESVEGIMQNYFATSAASGFSGFTHDMPKPVIVDPFRAAGGGSPADVVESDDESKSPTPLVASSGKLPVTSPPTFVRQTSQSTFGGAGGGDVHVELPVFMSSTTPPATSPASSYTGSSVSSVGFGGRKPAGLRPPSA
jgi:hypothetical protein